MKIEHTKELLRKIGMLGIVSGITLSLLATTGCDRQLEERAAVALGVQVPASDVKPASRSGLRMNHNETFLNGRLGAARPLS